MSERKKPIIIENAKFIFRTNFSGNPERDNYGSTARKANITIPNEEQAMELIRAGYNVKQTKPRPDEEEGFIPTYFVSIIANYDGEYPPKIYLVCGDSEPCLLTEDSVGEIDSAYVLNVNAVLNGYHSVRNNRNSLYIKNLYVEHDEVDPFHNRYGSNRVSNFDDEE